MNLFQTGQFKLHSGGVSHFKIDCDALTTADLASLARLVAERFEFGEVFGIPRGGERFAYELRKYVSDKSMLLLIVDDVLTTGNSMEEARERFFEREVQGIVIIARAACKAWVQPIFTMELG